MKHHREILLKLTVSILMVILLAMSSYAAELQSPARLNSGDYETRGTTHTELEPMLNVSGSLPEIGREVFYRLLESRSPHAFEEITREKWTIIDSVDIRTVLNAGEQIGSHYCSIENSFSTFISDGELLSESVKALEKAPAWMYNRLYSVLSQLSPERQRLWADLINDTEDPYVDEIAYCVAYSAPEYLESGFSTPELFIENVEMIYHAESKLPYVEIVHYGNSKTDPDFYSTTSYKKRNAEGEIVQIEAPRDIYYNYTNLSGL